MSDLEFKLRLLWEIYKQIRWHFIEKATGNAFSVPEAVAKALAPEFCGIAAQLVHKKFGGKIALLIQVCKPDKNGCDHLMNVSHDGKWFYDYYHNEIPAVKEGNFVNLHGRLFYVDKIVDEWADLGFKSFQDRCKYVRPRNEELNKIFGTEK